MKTKCSHCEKTFDCPEDYLGKKVKCTKCKEAFIVDKYEPAHADHWFAHKEPVGKAEDFRTDKRAKIKAKRIIFIVFVALFIFFSGFIAGSMLNKPARELNEIKTKLAEYKELRKSQSTPENAWKITTTFVKEELINPASAVFTYKDKDEQDVEKCVMDMDEDIFYVQGWVDSQNAFGATVRMQFEVVVRNTHEDYWDTIYPLRIWSNTKR